MSPFFFLSFYLQLTQAGSTICRLHLQEQYILSFEDLPKVLLFHIHIINQKDYICL